MSTLKKLGVLRNKCNKLALADKLLFFFRIASPEPWTSIYDRNSVAFKIDLKCTTVLHAISFWLRLAELLSEHIEVALFDKKSLSLAIK